MARLLLRLLLAVLFLGAGTLHLLRPRLFLPIMPPWIPDPLACVQVSGVCELLGGLGLLVPIRSVQVLCGWGLVLLLIAVFPANIYMAVAHVQLHGVPFRPWVSWARLPLQPLLIIGVMWVTRIWPFLSQGEKGLSTST